MIRDGKVFVKIKKKARKERERVDGISPHGKVRRDSCLQRDWPPVSLDEMGLEEQSGAALWYHHHMSTGWEDQLQDGNKF